MVYSLKWEDHVRHLILYSVAGIKVILPRSAILAI